MRRRWRHSRNSVPAGTWLVIAGNAAWVAASALLLVGGWVTPTLLGYGFVIVQAAAVTLLAAIEYAGILRA
jgi:hypothetical protein